VHGGAVSGVFHSVMITTAECAPVRYRLK
jgi:hypothetical protein